MKFTGTVLAGAMLIEAEKFPDQRGYYSRMWDQAEFAAHGLSGRIVQSDAAFNYQAHTLRGMHFQKPPYAQAKLVRCVTGALYDVIIDLRPDSPTFLRHVGVELTAENRLMLYVPEGFAHGYLTLRDNTEVAYQMSACYAPESAGGVRYNDPAFAITWPAQVKVIHPRDASYLDFKPGES